MTRYSRSVIPGRPQGDDGEKAVIDSMVFGGGKKRAPTPANDGGEPDFLPPVEDDEADLLVGRANADRRAGDDRRKPGSERRASDERRAASRRPADYAPLQGRGGYRGADDGRRGPFLLVGAVLIVAVFGVVVWNAYREDGTVSGQQVAELGESGPFKRPYIDTRDADAPTIAEEAEVLDALDGASAPGSVASTEVRPVTPAPATTAPAKPQPETRPPTPLNTPAPPVRAAAAVTEPGPISLTPQASNPASAAPAPASVAPKPVTVAAAAPTGAKPAFVASGSWLVQIEATSSEASALSEWTRHSKAAADLFSGAERVIQQADVNGKTVYRLRVGSFASKEDATAFCTAFKAKGGNCYPAAK